MPTEMERLVVTLEASIRQYEKALAKANGTTVSTLRKIENNVAASEKRQSAMLARVGAQMQGSVAGFLPAINGVTGAAGLAAGAVLGLGAAIASTVKSAAELGDMAEDLGVSTDFAQAFQKQIVKTGASLEDANKALFEMVKEINDADSPMRKLFDERKINIQGKSIEDIIKLYIEMISKIDNASDRLRILGDTVGAKLARKLSEGFREGAAGIEASQRAIAAGTEGWTEKQIKDAQKIETEWNAMWARIDVKWKDIILRMLDAWNTGFIQPMIASNQNAKSAVQQAWEGFRDWWKGQGLPDMPELPKLGDPSQAFGRGGPRGPVRPYVAPGYPTTTTGMYPRGKMGGRYEGGILGLIARAEGAAGPYGYNTVLGGGVYGGRGANLTGMTLAQVAELGEQIRQHPQNPSRHLGGSSAMGKYQIVNKTRQGLADKLGLGPETLYTPEIQDMMARELLRQRQGQGLAGLRDEWAGLKRVSDAQILAALGEKEPGLSQAPYATRGAAPGIEVGGKIQDRIKLTDTLIEKTKALKDETRLEGEGFVKNMEASGAELQEITDIAADAFGGLIGDLMNGVKAGEAFNNMLKRIAANLAQMAIQQIFSGGGAPGGLFGAMFGGGSGVAAQGIPGLPGLQHGGRFKVKGGGGTDSQVVAFRATPGEEVNVTPRGLRRGNAGMPGIAIGGAVINIAGNADERTLAEMDRKLARHSVAQRKALERDWGVMSLRYSRLRAP